MQDCFVQVGDLRLHYVDYGGNGPPLLLVHGTGLMARIWDELASILSTAFHVLALDRRGHGDSNTPAEGFQYTDVAADIAGFCAALGLNAIDAVGHSSGGSALVLASVLRLGLLRRAVLIDPLIFGPHSAGNRPQLGSMPERIARRRYQWPSRSDMSALLRSRPPHASWSPATLQAFVDHATRELPDGSVELKCLPEVEARMYQHDPDLDVFAFFAGSRTSFRIIRAGNSDRFPEAAGKHTCAVATDCRMVTLPDLSHFAPMEQPETVARLALALLMDAAAAPQGGMR